MKTFNNFNDLLDYLGDNQDNIEGMLININFIKPDERIIKENQQLKEENRKLKQILFDEIISPNCPTCPNFFSKLCDNGIICISKLINNSVSL